jgi:hypothetical protein
MSKREEYEQILSELKSSQSEEEVIDNLTKIIKSFSSDYYKNDIYENPYFKSLVSDIKKVIFGELCEIKSTLQEEISAIDKEIIRLNNNGITSITNEDYSKLRQLKRDCFILIKELDERLRDLNELY